MGSYPKSVWSTHIQKTWAKRQNFSVNETRIQLNYAQPHLKNQAKKQSAEALLSQSRQLVILKVQPNCFHAVTQVKTAHPENAQVFFYPSCLIWQKSIVKDMLKSCKNLFIITETPPLRSITFLTSHPPTASHNNTPPCCLRGTRGLPLVSSICRTW